MVTGGYNDIIDIMNGFWAIKLARNDISRSYYAISENWFSTLTAGRSLSPPCGIWRSQKPRIVILSP